MDSVILVQIVSVTFTRQCREKIKKHFCQETIRYFTMIVKL